jgi:hypothetical protein
VIFPKLEREVVQIAVGLFSTVYWTSSMFDKLHGSSASKTWKSFCLATVSIESNDWVNTKEPCRVVNLICEVQNVTHWRGECPSRTISTLPLGSLGRKWFISHVINISDVIHANVFDIITAESGGKLSRGGFKFLPTLEKTRLVDVSLPYQAKQHSKQYQRNCSQSKCICSWTALHLLQSCSK